MTQTDQIPATPNSTDEAEKTARPWYKKKRVIIPAVAIAAFAVFNVANSGDSETDSGNGTTVAQDAEAQAGIGDAVRDGKFEFTVDKVESLGDSVGDEFFGETAQGEYVGVTVTVTNIGDEAQSWFEDNQTLIIDGKEYSADSMATILVNDDGVYEEINPGNSLTVTLVYDIPVGSSPSAIELHDSAFSGGVTVQL